MESSQNSKPSIEQIVPFLYEVGDKLIDAATEVKLKKRRVKSAENEVKRLQQAVEDDQEMLLNHVNKHYCDSEIDAAVAMWRKVEQVKRVAA